MQILITILIAVVFFAFFLLALSLGKLMGRKRERRCACAESKVIMKKFEQRDRAMRQAAAYRPETVDTKKLPIIGQED